MDKSLLNYQKQLYSGKQCFPSGAVIVIDRYNASNVNRYIAGVTLNSIID